MLETTATAAARRLIRHPNPDVRRAARECLRTIKADRMADRIKAREEDAGS